MSQHITVVDYNPLWQEKYEKEARLIRKILADNCIAIYHIAVSYTHLDVYKRQPRSCQGRGRKS